MNVASAHETTQADVLREELVDKLIAQDAVRSSEVETALRTVPRHLFAPGVPWETAYANDTVVTKRDEHGIAISSVSAPWLQAMMLEQAQLGPGMRVLEIGSGGYNAALLTELVGEEGEVTSVDIDGDVVDRMVRHIQSWDRSSLSARIAAHPVGAPDDQLPEGALVIDKKHTRIVVSWPQ